MRRRYDRQVTDAQNVFDLLAEELREDPDADVTIEGTELRAKGSLFAFLDGEDLVVCLPQARAEDLVNREISDLYRGEIGGGRHWVVVTDRELWSELASEAHAFVGEPPVGRES